MRIVLMFLLLGGCDLLGDAAMTRSCVLPNGECQEYGVFGPDLLALQGVCESVGGQWGDGECPRDGITGGCEDIDASNPWDVTTWFYAADGYATADDVRAECEDGTEQYVDPPA